MRPYELLVRFAADGSIAGLSARHIQTVNGRDYELDPVPLASVADPAFADFSQAFNAAAVAELETAKTTITNLQAEVTRLEALVPPPVDPNVVPEFVTAVQGRLALHRAGLLVTVEQAVATANGETQIFWEYSAEWHRNNTVLSALAEAIGLTSEQVDDMFRTAKGL